MKIIVTGATGQLGRIVVKKLLGRIAANEIGVSVRDVEKAQDLQKLEIQVRHGNFSDPESLKHAFEGASQILIVSPNVTGEAAIIQHQNAIDAAKNSGAKRILYTSHMGASSKSEFAPMLSHAAAERYLEASGVSFTSFRNGFYAESAVMMLDEAIKTGELKMPEDGLVAWTSHEDLAEVAATVLSDGGFEGISPNLTGSEVIDFQKIAEILSEITGREIRRVVMPDEKYEELMIARRVPQERINIVMGMFRASRKGEFLKTDSTLEKIIGRKPLSMRDVLKATFSKHK